MNKLWSDFFFFSGTNCTAVEIFKHVGTAECNNQSGVSCLSTVFRVIKAQRIDERSRITLVSSCNKVSKDHNQTDIFSVLPGDPASLHEAGRVSSSFANGRVAARAAAGSAVRVGAVRAVSLSAGDSGPHEVSVKYEQ